jgi:DNA-binding transcriptional MerR regulator
MNAARKSHSNIPRYAWGLAAISILLLLIVITVSIDLLEYTRKNKALDTLKKASSSLDYAVIEDAAKKSSQTKGLAAITSWVLGRKQELPVESMLNLVEVIKQVDIDQLPSATQLFELTSAPLSKPYDPELDEGNADPLTLIRTNMEAALATAKKVAEIENDLDKINVTKAEIKVAYEDLSIKILTFLGLPSTRTSNNLKFYQSGALKGLPVLQRIPDENLSLEEFGNILQKEGGSVTSPEGENAHRYFLAKISEFQDSAVALTMKVEEMQEKLSAKQEILEKEKKLLGNKKNSIKAMLLAMITNINEDQIVLDYKTARYISNML